jgi:hypothetical protein
MYAFPISPVRATCLTHLTLLDLFTVIICCEGCTLWRSSLCSLLQSPTTPFSSALCSETPLSKSFQRICQTTKPRKKFPNTFLLRWGAVSNSPIPLAGGPPLVGCPRFLIQYIRSYPSYLEAVFSICNRRTRDAIVTRYPHNIESSISWPL